MDCCSKNHNHQTKNNIKNQNITPVVAKKKSSKLGILLLCIAGATAGIVVLKLMNIRIGAILPYAVFLLCPLMHIFMMRGHGDHTEDHKTKS